MWHCTIKSEKMDSAVFKNPIKNLENAALFIQKLRNIFLILCFFQIKKKNIPKNTDKKISFNFQDIFFKILSILVGVFNTEIPSFGLPKL